MAQQESIIKLKGQIGDLTFYKTADGYRTRKKTGISAERMATDPRFARTRENGREFARTGKAVKLLRASLKPLLGTTADRTWASRLMKRMSAVVKADSTCLRGDRKVAGQNVGMLKDFSFNANASIPSVVLTPFTPEINRVSGALTVTIPAFDPASMISPYPGATHLQFKIAAVLLDFDVETRLTVVDPGVPIPIDTPTTTCTVLTCNLPPNSSGCIFLVMGIDFYYQSMARYLPLNDLAHTALDIVAVSGT